MTIEDIERIKAWIKTLDGDEKQGAMDALQRIMMGRMGGGGGGRMMPPPPEIDVDPDLEEPEDEPSSSEPDDTEIDDPDELLKGKSSGSDDIPEDEDGKDDEGDTDKDGKKEKDGKDGKDGDGKSKDGKDGGDDDKIDDTDDGLDDDLTKDLEAEEKRKNEIFGRKVDAARAIKQINKALKELESDPSKGTAEDKAKLEGLKEQLSQILEDLKENPDSIDDMTAAEFNELIRQALDAVDKTGVHVTKITDVKDRLKKISDDNIDTLDIDEIDDEDRANKQVDPEYQKLKAREAEKDRLRREMEASKSRAFDGNMESFKADLQKALGDQIAEMIETEEETWAKENRHHDDDDIAVPGIRIDEIPEYKKPSVDVYFDQSGSWGTEEVDRGMAAIADILKLEKENLLTINIFYFSKILSQNQDAARSEGSQECWDLVVDQIMAAPKTKNVIIMTDTDIGHDYGYAGHHGCIEGKGGTVEGCVWYLWKNGRRVAQARSKLKGLKGTFEYSV